jgi:hypothetical protein
MKVSAKKIIVVLLAISLMIVFVAGCSSKTTNATAQSSQNTGGITISSETREDSQSAPAISGSNEFVVDNIVFHVPDGYKASEGEDISTLEYYYGRADDPGSHQDVYIKNKEHFELYSDRPSDTEEYPGADVTRSTITNNNGVKLNINVVIMPEGKRKYHYVYTQIDGDERLIMTSSAYCSSKSDANAQWAYYDGIAMSIIENIEIR